MDNVFIERVWRSMKYEDVYLKGHTDGREAKAGIGDWIIFLQRAPSSGARLSRADGRLAQTGAALLARWWFASLAGIARGR
jgi:hypothetical protein